MLALVMSVFTDEKTEAEREFRIWSCSIAAQCQAWTSDLISTPMFFRKAMAYLLPSTLPPPALAVLRR